MLLQLCPGFGTFSSSADEHVCFKVCFCICVFSLCLNVLFVWTLTIRICPVWLPLMSGMRRYLHTWIQKSYWLLLFPCCSFYLILEHVQSVKLISKLPLSLETTRYLLTGIFLPVSVWRKCTYDKLVCYFFVWAPWAARRGLCPTT